MFELRRLTRDVLLEYNNNIMPPKPRAAGLDVVYPWENMSLSNLTKDLLLEYNNNIVPPQPHTVGLSMVYPWENISLSNLAKQLYLISLQSGYTGTQNEFMANFGAYLQNKEIIFNNYDNFPETGDNAYLYFDLDEKILYYWDNEYIPINTLLIENTILNAGSSTD